MPTGYQVLPCLSRHKRKGDDSPNLETQQENEPISGIKCLFRFYRSALGKTFLRVYEYPFCCRVQVSKILFGSTQKGLQKVNNKLIKVRPSGK